MKKPMMEDPFGFQCAVCADLFTNYAALSHHECEAHTPLVAPESRAKMWPDWLGEVAIVVCVILALAGAMAVWLSSCGGDGR